MNFSQLARSFAALILIVCTVRMPAQMPSPEAPDVLFVHGDILTGTRLRAGDADPTPGRVTALAVLHGRIVAAGSDAAMLALKSPTTKIVDLGGHFAMPGFNDAHTHIASAGQQRLTLDLDNVASLAAMQGKIKAYAATLAPGDWIRGGGWDHTKWSTATLPTRDDLDAASAGHPAYLERTDGHIAVVNTAALAAAGITDATPDPAGGKIDRDADGHATGIIRETPALLLLQAQIPPPSTAVRRHALELSIADALAHGVTSLQDFSNWDDWLVLEAMEREGKLPIRIAEWMDFNLSLDVLKSHRASHDANDPLLHLTQLKGFMDGSLGSRTAALVAPYADDPQNSGIPRYDQARLNQMSAERAAAGFQLGFHAIGDRANNMALNAFDAVDRSEDKRRQKEIADCYALHPEAHRMGDGCGTFPRLPYSKALRFRIEHAQVLLPTDFQRLHDLGIIASMQPSHLLTDMAWAGARLGPERAKYAYAWKSFLDHGVTLAFGTDYPVESISPFRGLYAAVTRSNEAGTQTFQPQEILTIQQAIYAYTQASAFAEFRETLKGRLAPGFVCDMVVLDRDITHATPQEILHTKVLRTIVGGTTVFLPQSGAQPARQ